MEKYIPFVILLMIFLSAIGSVFFACGFGIGNLPKLGLEHRIEVLG